MRIVAAVVLACVALSAPAMGQTAPAEKPTRAPAANRVDLRPRFKKGQEVRFKLVLDSKQTGGDAGQGSTTSQEIGVLLRCRDTNADTGSTLDLVYESLKIKAKLPVGDVDFDSAKPADPDNMFDPLLRGIVGLTLPVTMDKDGNISALGGGDGGLGALTRQLGGGADMIKGLVGPIFTAKKGDARAAVGESWINEDTMQGAMGAMRLKFTHTLTSHRGGKAIIDMKGAVTLDPSSAGKAAIRDSTITGRTLWDTESGMLESMESRQRLTVQTTGETAGLSTQEMNVRVTRVK